MDATPHQTSIFVTCSLSTGKPGKLSLAGPRNRMLLLGLYLQSPPMFWASSYTSVCTSITVGMLVFQAEHIHMLGVAGVFGKHTGPYPVSRRCVAFTEDLCAILRGTSLWKARLGWFSSLTAGVFSDAFCYGKREDASPYMLAKDFGWVPILASPSCRTDYIQRGRLSSEGCCSMAAIHSPLKRAFIHSSAASTGSATLSPSRKVVVVIHSVIRGPVTYGAPTFKANSSGKEGCNAGCNFIANLQSEDRSRSIPEAY